MRNLTNWPNQMCQAMLSKQISLVICLIVIHIVSAFDDEPNQRETPAHDKHSGTLPKDKLLMEKIKNLTFYRNKRTTSKRTHSIHQLSCVGGTAGCKLFTPDSVECEKIGYNEKKGKYDWICRADISDRVKFNHVEVICEGYDYPEDDYILAGSCGLEFTLDYADPSDYHHKSYFNHLDSHEKERHQESRRKPKVVKDILPASWLSGLVIETIVTAQHHILFISLTVTLSLFFLILVRFFTSNHNRAKQNGRKPRAPGYGPLTSAVLTTKKAC